MSRASFMFLSLSSTIRISSLAMSDWKRESEGRTLAGRACKREDATVQLDEAPGEREPQPGAFGLARVVASDLPELLEHDRLVFRRDADPGIGDRNLDRRAVQLRRDVYLPALGGELHCVRKKVQHDLLELALVGAEVAEGTIHLQVEPDPVALRALANEGQRILQRGG